MPPTLQTAIDHLQAGRLAEAEAAAGQLLAAQPANAAALQVLALVHRQSGRMDEAEAIMRRSVALAPGNPEVRANLAQLLGARSKIDESIEEFRRSLAIDPRFRPALLGLARALHRAGDPARAEELLRRLLAWYPDDAQGWSALGSTCYANARVTEARAALERAVALAPRSAQTRHQLAALLCDQDHAEESLAQSEAATRAGSVDPRIALIRARALMQLDRYAEAEDTLTSFLAAAPDDTEGHFLLAQLRRTRGESDFLRGLRDAAARAAATPATRSAYADVLRRRGDLAGSEAVLRRLIDQCGRVPQLLTSLGTLLHEAGRYDDAVDLTREGFAASPADATAAENFVAALLSAGRGREALPVVERFRAHAPLDQRWITYRADVARMLREAHYDTWCDLQHVVQVFDLPAPRGYASIEDFNAALAAALASRHRQRSHPLDQSLRNGTQSSRGLLVSDDPVIRAFLDAMVEPIGRFQAVMPVDRDHPLHARNTGPAAMVGCWSVRLQRGGYHVNHIHPQGWISSAYYVSVPAEVADASARSGWIKFGEPRFAMPGCAAGRFVQPRAGRLVLFPSYLWHGTTPIQGDEARLAIAFDATSPPARL